MIFRAFSVILGSVMRGAGDTRSPMTANILMNLTNIVLNFFLIYDTRPVHPGGLALTIPGAGLGVVGAAIGTAVSYCVGGIFMIVVYWRNRILSPKGYPLHFDRSLAAKCLRIGTPVAMERVSACLGQVVFTSLVTRLGTLALATHSIAITAEQAFYIPGYGMQAAASTMAGNALGKQDEKEFRQVTKTIAAIAVALMTVTGALLFAFPGQMMSLFTEDAQVIAGGITVLRIVAVSEPMFAALIIFEGVFNGIGDTRAPFVFSIISMWGVRIAGTCLCVIFLHAGLELVWVCMVGDNVTRCLLLGHRFVRGSRSKDRAWRKRFGSGTMKESEK
jgi:putative MATE family efflux protein